MSSKLSGRIFLKKMMIDRAKIDVLPFDSPLLASSLARLTFQLSSEQNRDRSIVITGFNTDVEHDGVVYHVQTEDKGLDSPLILSLVYAGGAILASKRSPYEDLIEIGFDEAVLADRLKRQHRLICAAIRAGRVDELKRMTSREPITGRLVAPPSAPVTEPSNDATSESQDIGDVTIESTRPPSKASQPAHEFVPQQQTHITMAELEEGLRVNLLEEQEFRSGQALHLSVIVTRKSGGEEKPVSGVAVSVKVLGTMFRPVIVSTKTQRDGTATITAAIPKFSSGRAALLVRAVRGGESVEIRRVVHPAR